LDPWRARPVQAAFCRRPTGLAAICIRSAVVKSIALATRRALCALFAFAALGAAACGSSEKTPDAQAVDAAADCSGCRWYEGSDVQKGDPGVGRHSLGAYPPGCYRQIPYGMNIQLERCADSCCGR
jgi:hypothetical protein